MLKKFNAKSKPHLSAVAPQVEGYDEERINIGLVFTGGGSHGAFEAGVIEAILPTLTSIGKIETISGTSAGTTNAIAVGSGLNHSGVDEAIRRIRKIWSLIPSHGAAASRHSRFLSDVFLPQQAKWPNIPQMPFNLTQAFAPYMPSMNAQYISSLMRQIAPNWRDEVQHGQIKIAVNTVLEDIYHSGEFEHVILTGDDLTPDGAGASTNLEHFGYHYIRDTHNPRLMGRRAYDGAKAENGPVSPHVNAGVTDLIMIVLHDRRHNKLDKKGELKHAEIHSHALDLAAHDSHMPIRLHSIEIETLGGEIGGLSHINDSSKMNTDKEFIQLLYDAGLKAGHKWLEKNAHLIGQQTSYEIYKPALDQFSEVHYA